MAHTAAIYSVKVHPKRKTKDLKPFGDFDGRGSDLAVVLNGFLSANFTAETDDKSRLVKASSTALAKGGSEVVTVVYQSESGLAARILDPNQVLKYQQRAIDTSQVNIASVLRLPAGDTVGWWAVHVNNRRGAKTLMERGLQDRFGKIYPDYMLKITPAVPGKAIREAVKQGHVDKVRLVKYERPDTRELQATDDWIEKGEEGVIEVSIKGRRGSHVRLIPDRVITALGGTREEIAEVIEFEGTQYDEMFATVELSNGVERTFNVTTPEAGHPLTVVLDKLKYNDNGDPTPASLFKALGAAIDDMDT